MLDNEIKFKYYVTTILQHATATATGKREIMNVRCATDFGTDGDDDDDIVHEYLDTQISFPRFTATRAR